MGTPETSREPCPDRILDDIGGAFGMGAVGGSAFHFLKGIYNSPKGERLVGGTQAVRMNAPRVGGSFAVWGGLFSAFDCTMVYVRQKEDPWNSIFAGAATGGFLQMRQGLGPASRSALFGGVLLAMIEGAGIMLNRVLSPPANMPMEEGMPPGMPPGFPMGQLPGQQQPHMGGSAMSMEDSSSGSASSWFGGLFGGDKKKEDKSSGGIQIDDGPVCFRCLRGAIVGNSLICKGMPLKIGKARFLERVKILHFWDTRRVKVAADCFTGQLHRRRITKRATCSCRPDWTSHCCYSFESAWPNP
ncbi:hypothetical protein MKW98_007549 [Papaver atlanticum]|uniref:Mitochondrial import inner membrane translocase subunit TIM17-2-like n=1 Tax=Papaver atlanticum TaxID=357466 RepID=A0AAD4SDH3_9MAGN|nr:hypothetical protein MKW98_007549 [Papaver atlanticum]